VVSHDKWLIETSCQRFWYINNNRLEEYLDVEEVYQQIEQQSHIQNNSVINEKVASPHIHEAASQSTVYEDELLEKLLLLEDKLHADRQRKLAHQKPLLQQQWIDEIEKIQALLNL